MGRTDARGMVVATDLGGAHGARRVLLPWPWRPRRRRDLVLTRNRHVSTDLHGSMCGDTFTGEENVLVGEWSGSKCIPPNLGTPFLTFSYPHYKTHKKDQKRSIEYHAYQPYRMRAEKNTNRT